MFLQFHHVPLYLEWAPIGVFGAAPQKKDSQPEQPAEKAEVEQETGENKVWGHLPVPWAALGGGWGCGEAIMRSLARCPSFCPQIDSIGMSSAV